MAVPDPKIVSLNELRFRPANSNDRERAGMVHDFEDVPACAFGKDDGISPYMAADSTIDDFPQNPATHEVIHEDVPDVLKDGGEPALAFGHRILRSGFALSVFLHAALAVGLGYATLKLPDDSALLEGETVIAVEFYSDTDSEVTTRTEQVDQEGEEEAVDEPVEKPKEEPKLEVAKPVEEPVKPVEQVKPAEQAKLPEPVEKPVEAPPAKVEEPVIGADVPEVLSTIAPSTWDVEAAAKQILDETEIQPLPEMPPQLLVTPVEEKKVEPEKTLAQPLAHPVSKPRLVEKVAEVKPVEKPIEKPVEKKPEAKKEEPKPVEKKPEPKKEEPKKVEQTKPEPKSEKKPIKKKTVAREGNADVDSNKGSSQADKNKKGESQDASQGNSKSKVKGNASTSNYKGLVQRKLERAKKRVRVAGKGKVLVSFTITANGSVVNLRVRTSSGKPAIDAGALDVVRKASPFPAIPPETGLKSYPVSVPMTFKGN